MQEIASKITWNRMHAIQQEYNTVAKQDTGQTCRIVCWRGDLLMQDLKTWIWCQFKSIARSMSCGDTTAFWIPAMQEARKLIGKCLMHCWIPRPQDPHNISHQNWPKLCGHIVVSTTLYRPTMPHPGIQAAVLGCLCERAHLNFGPALLCSPILSKKTFNYQHGRQSKLNTSQQSQNDKMNELEFDFVQSVGQNSRLLSVELQPVAPGPTKTTSRPQVLRSGRPKIHRSLFWHAVCLVKPPLHRIAVSIWM